jgi:hypothetical protein
MTHFVMSLILLLIVRSMQYHDIILPRLSYRNDDRLLRYVSGFTLNERPIDTTLFRQAGHEPTDEVVSVDCEPVGQRRLGESLRDKPSSSVDLRTFFTFTCGRFGRGMITYLRSISEPSRLPSDLATHKTF